jgi:tetrahydromethanopterin S-methyltransferase subunit F
MCLPFLGTDVKLFFFIEQTSFQGIAVGFFINNQFNASLIFRDQCQLFSRQLKINKKNS